MSHLRRWTDFQPEPRLPVRGFRNTQPTKDGGWQVEMAQLRDPLPPIPSLRRGTAWTTILGLAACIAAALVLGHPGLIGVMPLGVIDWILSSEPAVGQGHPTLPDIDNRPLKQVVTDSGYNPDAVFSGFLGPVFNAKARAFAAQGDGIANDTAALQQTITAAGANGIRSWVILPYSANPYLTGALTGLSGVTILGLGGRPTLKAIGGSNATVLTGTALSDFHVINIEIDGNKANQSGSGLADTPANTVGPRGVFLDTCTRSSVERSSVHDCRFHGVLFYLGADNWAEHVEASANGSLANTCFGNGFYVYGSARFRGAHIRGYNNDANSGVSLSGAAAVDAALSDIIATGNNASNITINSPRCRLRSFYAQGGVGNSGQGLNVGHDTDSDLYADGFIGSDGTCEGNAACGVTMQGIVGGRLTNIVSKNNALHNLLITGARAGRLRFAICDFDTTTTTAAAPSGVGVHISASGAGSTLGDIQFHGCDAHGAQRNGVRASGVSRVRWIGGSIYDNGNNVAGPGILSEDNGALPSNDVVSVGTNFYDTRAGAARTQTVPMQTTGTGDRCRCFMFDARNHLTNDNPQMGAANDFFFGATGAQFLSFGATGGAGTLSRSGTITAGFGTFASDISATGGYRQTIDGWFQETVVAAQAGVPLTRLAGTTEVPTRWIAPRAGSVTSVSVKSNAARTAGTLIIRVYKNGAQLGAIQAVLDGTNTTFNALTQAKDTSTFVAGDELELTITTDAAWLPITAHIRASLEVET